MVDGGDLWWWLNAAASCGSISSNMQLRHAQCKVRSVLRDRHCGSCDSFPRSTHTLALQNYRA